MSIDDLPKGWEDQVPVNHRTIARFGYALFALFCGTFGYWGITAPLAGAAIAPGIVVAQGRNIAIQHLEGGIVGELPIVEGDAVEAGDILIVLDPTSAQTRLDRLLGQWVTNSAMIARLTTERDGLSKMPIDKVRVENFDENRITTIYNEQRKEFAARLSRYNSEQDILKQRVKAYEQAHDGLTAQLHAVKAQLDIVTDELDRKKTLIDKGLTNHFEYTQILRNQADLTGQLGVIHSELATAETQRIEALEQQERLETQRVEGAVTRLNEIRTSQADIEDQLTDARHMLARTKVRAPVNGIVISSYYNAIGTVVPPGGEIMHILPTGDGYVVEAKLKPQDIDIVQIGQDARLHLSALNVRRTPEIKGRVIHLSADHLIDQTTKEPYYLARISVMDDLAPPLTIDQIYPGMPVEVFISTGERTFFEYLAKPITDSFGRAFARD